MFLPSSQCPVQQVASLNMSCMQQPGLIRSAPVIPVVQLYLLLCDFLSKQFSQAAVLRGYWEVHVNRQQQTRMAAHKLYRQDTAK